MKFAALVGLGITLCGALLLARRRWVCQHERHVKYDAGKVYEYCALCQKRFGRGWDFTGIPAPVPFQTEEERRRACLALVSSALPVADELIRTAPRPRNDASRIGSASRQR